MKTIGIYLAAAFFEITGSFAFWAWQRLDKPFYWGLIGVLLLAIFGFLLTKSEALFAGRAFAAYGGIYIVSSLVWLGIVEKVIIDRWDFLGAFLCILGAGFILWGPRGVITG